MNTKNKKRLFQGMGLGYITCIFTHIIAAVLPMYVIFPFAQGLFGHGDSCGHHGHGHGVFSHILGDIMVLTMVIIPVALLTWGVHKLLCRFKGAPVSPSPSPCDDCQHKP